MTTRSSTSTHRRHPPLISSRVFRGYSIYNIKRYSLSFHLEWKAFANAFVRNLIYSSAGVIRYSFPQLGGHAPHHTPLSCRSRRR